MKRRMASTLVGLLLSLVVLELAVRGMVRTPVVQELLFGAGAPLGVAMRRPPLGPACAGVMSSTVQPDPDLGWVAAWGRRELEEFTQEVEPPGVRRTGVEAAPGARRVALVGDSFTFGHDVDDEETWAAGLARRRPDLDVLNFGVDGYGHDQILLRVRRDVLPLKPEVVVLGMVHVDVLRNGLSRFRRLRPRVHLRDGELIVEGLPVPTPEEDCRRLMRSSWTIEVVRMLLTPPLEARLPEAFALTDALLEALLADVRGAGAELVIIDLPEAAATMLDPAAPPALAPPYFGFPAEHPGYPIHAWCERHGVTCLDGDAAFAGVEDLRSMFVPSFHYTPEGNARVAEWLATRLLPSTP